MQSFIAGQNVRVAIFDTGLPAAHPHFRFIQNRIDWTDERSADDCWFYFFSVNFSAFTSD